MKRIDRAAAGLALILPLFLLHGRGIADTAGSLLGLLFVVRSATTGDWSWLRRIWMRIGLVWWAWLVVCSARWGGEQVLQAVLILRFLLLVAALEHWALREDRMRRWLAGIVRAAFAYIALNSAVQFATGRNLYGWPRGAAGELTGPYREPRAGPILARLFFPALLPPVMRLAGGAGWRPLGGALLLIAGAALMLLTGQRIPFLLTLFGLFVTALFMPRLRMPVLMALIGAGALISVLRFVSPPAFERQVVMFSAQMRHFPETAYGQIAARALAIGDAHPVMGRGFDGFRRACAHPRYFHGWYGGPGGGAAICVQHPHNHYLQAYVESGLPGLLLFCALVAAWLLALLPGLIRDPDPLRVGLFVAALLHEWPIASASDFVALPLSGWFFLLLGLGLAETHAYIARRTRSEVSRA